MNAAAPNIEENTKGRGYPQEVKDAAKFMYLRRVPVKHIAKQLGLNNTRVVYQWVKKGNWEAMLQHETVAEATSRRMIALVEKEDKTDADLRELEKLTTLLDRLAGIDLKKAKAARERARAEIGDRTGGSGKKGGVNDISSITPEKLKEIRDELFFEYQHNWFENRHQRRRFILKSRQIGATFYFSWEAFENAVVNGENQAFLSASKSQAFLFKSYIYKFALEYFDVKLRGGDNIELLKDGKPWCTLYFLSTNSASAQGPTGNLYVDEVFWIPGFERLNTLATGIASQKRWRTTYFSTPSVKSHGAFPLWSGEKYNEKRKKNPVEFDLSHDTLRGGQLGPDNIWRDIVTVKDAEAMGCNLFDIEELQEDYTKLEFNNLFMCQFMEAGLSVFDLDDLLAGAVDSVVWVDFKKKEVRPYGNHPVWIGYDPARVGDRSTAVVVAPPLNPKGKFRILEKLNLKGTFKHQASRIKELTERYNVQFIGIDRTGIGLGVFEEVQLFYPRATPIHYSPEVKTTLVLKAVDVVERHKIQWDAEHTDIPQAFLQVHQTTTGNDQITYAADRTSATGHADVAWSIMHALHHEPLTGRTKKTSIAI
ncbi:terminase [Pseudomaricurvus alkylphenolicus]|uniref:terminase large subunit domain-containing protein n=1 Tax=Pseudomaricurvus alkylphenolicus TaxID=1306991 RepID=UPI001420D4D2|nr:terminase family protein [Pseudomaricurvus alkylphenolicus]NIB44785.1 terminase [Pseudomaricurvus alkylphenolicus]